MSQAPMALVAEPDPALRELMRLVLRNTGYAVFESANALELEVELCDRRMLVATRVLFVLGVRLATHCSLAICAAARERARAGLPEVKLVLTYEFGTLATVPDPELGQCQAAGVLEKPFDLRDLEAIALGCRFFPSESGANGA